MIDFERVTTRGGDRGESSLFNGERRPKSDLLFAALGDLDELSSALGLTRAVVREANRKRELYECQQVLFKIGAQVATPEHDPMYRRLELIEDADLELLEERQERLMRRVVLSNQFITPGDTAMSAHCDLARAVCRRTERTVVMCIRTHGLTHLAPAQNYLYRMSDYLFVLARYLEQHHE